jgi:hypothetical protein
VYPKLGYIQISGSISTTKHGATSSNFEHIKTTTSTGAKNQIMQTVIAQLKCTKTWWYIQWSYIDYLKYGGS